MLGCLWINRVHHSKLKTSKPPHSFSRRRLGVRLLRVRLLLLCLWLYRRHMPLSRLRRRGNGILGGALSMTIRRLTFLSLHWSKLLLRLPISPLLLLLVLVMRMRWLFHLRSVSKPTMLMVRDVPRNISRTATVATENTIRMFVREHFGWRVEQKGQIRGTSPETLPA